MYRDTRLGETVSVFVEDGVKVAITGFKADNWAERNAGVYRLLFVHSSIMFNNKDSTFSHAPLLLPHDQDVWCQERKGQSQPLHQELSDW